MFCLDGLRLIPIFYFDPPESIGLVILIFYALEQRRAPMHRGYFIFSEQHGDAAGEIGDDFVLARHHRGNIHRQSFHRDAVSREFMRGTFIILRRFQQRLRWDAADIQAGPAQAGLALRVFPLIYTDRIEPQLGAAYCRHIAAGAGAYYRYIKRL